MSTLGFPRQESAKTNPGTVEFQFALGDRVRLLHVDSPGVVHKMIAVRGGMNEYCILYWHEGDRCEVWVYADEISLDRVRG
jgi:hypothetical protein